MYFESFGQAQDWLRWLKRMKKKNSTPFNNARFQINLGEYEISSSDSTQILADFLNGAMIIPTR
jgi:hypothetical protein